MKTAEDHLLNGHKYASVEDVLVGMSAGEIIEIMQTYAREVAQDALNRAAQNAEIDYRGQETQFPIEIIESTITTTEIFNL